jgi:hypothetical protein
MCFLMHGSEHAQRLLGGLWWKLVVLGEAFSEAGLVVPTYVTINSIEELNANKDIWVKLLVLVVVPVFMLTRLKAIDYTV